MIAVADLTVTLGEDRFLLEGSSSALHLRAPGLRAAWRLRRAVAAARPHLARLPLADVAGHVDVWVRDHRIATVDLKTAASRLAPAGLAKAAFWLPVGTR